MRQVAAFRDIGPRAKASGFEEPRLRPWGEPDDAGAECSHLSLALGFAFPVPLLPALRTIHETIDEFCGPASTSAGAWGQPQWLRHHSRPYGHHQPLAGHRSRYPGQPTVMAFTDSRHGYLVGSNRMIRETNDGGHWNERGLDLPDEETSA